MPNLPSLADIASHHVDAEAALRLLFSRANPNFDLRFSTYLKSEVDADLIKALNETNLRSSLVVLARVEAALRVDYLTRFKMNKPDQVSIRFRQIFRVKNARAHLDRDIIQTWYDYVGPQERAVLSQLRGMFKFRHWLAHGRYWVFVSKYTFGDVYLIADAVMQSFPLYI